MKRFVVRSTSSVVHGRQIIIRSEDRWLTPVVVAVRHRRSPAALWNCWSRPAGALSKVVSIRPLSISSAKDNNNDESSDPQGSTKSTSLLQPSSSSPLLPEHNKSAGKSSSSSSSTTNIIALYASLAKARLSALVVGTTAAGYLAAGPTVLEPYSMMACLTGTALCASSAAAYNQIYEQSRDAQMKRTIHRPLVTKQLSTPSAFIAATVWGISGPVLLYTMGGGTIPALLGAVNIILYVGVYTPLKPLSVTNTWVGAVVGAIPPVMGYAAAMAPTSTTITTTTATTCAATLVDPVLLFQQLSTLVCLDPISTSLAALLYFWQLPHFMALSYMYRADYARGGFVMLSNRDDDGQATANVMVRYSYYTATIPIIATLTGVTSTMFAVEGLLLNGYAIAMAHQFRNERTNQNARRVFLTSLWYLPCTLMLFLLHSKTWDEDHAKNNTLQEQNGASSNVWLIQQITDQV